MTSNSHDGLSKSLAGHIEQHVLIILQEHGDSEYSQTKLARVAAVTSKQLTSTLLEKMEEPAGDHQNQWLEEDAMLQILQEHGDPDYSTQKLTRVTTAVTAKLNSAVKCCLGQWKSATTGKKVNLVVADGGSQDKSESESIKPTETNCAKPLTAAAKPLETKSVKRKHEKIEDTVTTPQGIVKAKRQRAAHKMVRLTWEEKFQCLAAYKKEYGDLNPSRGYSTPEEGFRLGRFVENVRGGQTKITQEQRAELDSLGFVFEQRSKTNWNGNFEALKKFIKDNGHARVPKKYEEEEGGFKLGRWVEKMRAAKKKCGGRKLTPEQQKKLDNVGFVWSVKK